VRQRFPTSGGAAKLRAFITDELAPWVQSQYRTAPYRILVGHSFGGLFAIDALAQSPRAFNAYVAISPSLWWDDGRYVKRVETALAASPLDGRVLYMTTGEREGSDMIDPARELAAALDARRPAGFRSSFRVMPTETHGSNPLRTEYDALERIFDGWEPADSVSEAGFVRGDVSGLEAHAAELTRRYGFPVTVSLDEVNEMAYYHLRQKHLDVALKLFRHNVERSPDYANGWDSLADGLEADGKLAEALQAQEKAVKLGEAQRDPLVGQFQAHLERLKKGSRR
jgi:tetratricopeptide (TPR) repeat protein